MAPGISSLCRHDCVKLHYGSLDLLTLASFKFHTDYSVRTKSLFDCLFIFNLLQDFTLNHQHVAGSFLNWWLESLDFSLELKVAGEGDILFLLCEVCVKFGCLKLLGELGGSWPILQNYFWVFGLACLASEAGVALGEIFSITLNMVEM